MDAPRRISIADGRSLAVDDVGDPDGRPVLYLHGNPDSRLARHPDDGVAARGGVRLLALDRPGFGDSDPDPAGGIDALGDDVGRLLDALDVASVALLGWSSGGLAALTVAARLGPRIDAVVTVAAMPPVEAYADPAVLDALGPSRRHFADMASEMPPAELAEELAPYLVPLPIDPPLALEHVQEGAGSVGRAELASVPGAAEQLARALVAAVQQGTTGIEQDLRLQLTPGLDLASVTAPVRFLHGTRDEASPPEVGRWLSRRAARGTLEVVEAGGHHLLFPHWEALMRSLGTLAGG